MSGPEVHAFLNHLMTERSVAASTQNQALSAVLFVYRKFLEIELRWLNDLLRAKVIPQSALATANAQRRMISNGPRVELVYGGISA